MNDLAKEYLEKFRKFDKNIVSITADVDYETRAKHDPDATYISTFLKIILKKDKQIVFARFPNKYGTMIDDIYIIEPTKNNGEQYSDTEDVYVKSLLDFIVNDIDNSTEQIAIEIYDSTRLYINREIDLEKVTQEDIKYLIDKLDTIFRYKKNGKTFEGSIGEEDMFIVVHGHHRATVTYE